jgi:hypothetical protein
VPFDKEIPGDRNVITDIWRRYKEVERRKALCELSNKTRELYIPVKLAQLSPLTLQDNKA